MNNSVVDRLNEQFAINQDGHSLRFSPGEHGIPVGAIENNQASCSVSLQGAHVLSWVPAGEEEVIWLSELARLEPGKSLRGGIPICWPWFGAHHDNAEYPAHGFARTSLWQVTDTRVLPGGETQIAFTLDSRELDQRHAPMWPWPTVVEYRLTVGGRLTMELATVNHSHQTITIGQALHTYFKVDDVTRTIVHGLDGREYLDKTDSFRRKKQTGPVTIDAEVDRLYVHTSDDIIIDDGHRRIGIKKQGSHSTVVWNPWSSVAEKMGDLGKDGYLHMLCVESANAAEDIVSIEPGKRHELRVTYTVDS